MGKSQASLEVEEEESRVPRSECAEKEIPKVLHALSATFERLVMRNEKCLPDLSEHRRLTIYHGLRPPSITISKYLERIHKYTNCSPSCFVAGYIYIDHLVHKQPNLPLISLNVHRLLITSIMVATKLYDDEHYNNAFYARVGGMSVTELNSLEIDFLFRLDFRLQVTPNTFEGYCTHLEREMLLAGQQIERPLPSAAFCPSEHRSKERLKVQDDPRRKLRLSMNHASSFTSATTMEPLESPTG